MWGVGSGNWDEADERWERYDTRSRCDVKLIQVIWVNAHFTTAPASHKSPTSGHGHSPQRTQQYRYRNDTLVQYHGLGDLESGEDQCRSPDVLSITLIVDSLYLVHSFIKRTSYAISGIDDERQQSTCTRVPGTS